MKNLIQQVQSNFIDEIKKGNIEVIKADQISIGFTVMSEYEFSIIIYKDSKRANIWEQYSENSFINLPKLTEEEQSDLFNTVLPLQEKYMREISLVEKKKELKKLTAEIESISNL